mmetsp:Transcript_46784/g.108682  ORF Transcript_46784/g.108682 Transcript_46784/m.108682 type:complete len:187 (-) Transcript_46784:104-664(-)
MLLLLATLFLAAPLRPRQQQGDCVFGAAELLGKDGLPRTCDDLRGRQVALYFAGSWCPLCRQFTPALRDFFARHKETVQIVFVSSDESPNEAVEHYQKTHGDWLALSYADPLVRKLKRRFGVWSRREIGWFGVDGRRSGVPAVVVIDWDGAELEFVPSETQGAAALAAWQPEATGKAWPSPDELRS